MSRSPITTKKRKSKVTWRILPADDPIFKEGFTLIPAQRSSSGGRPKQIIPRSIDDRDKTSQDEEEQK